MNDPAFLMNLPSEIITNILSRLPIRTIITCKCVCKKWLELLSTPEFVKSHLSISTLGIVIYQHKGIAHLCKIVEFEDELELEHHELHYKPVMTFDLREFISLTSNAMLEFSVNGLFFLRQIGNNPDDLYNLYLCNPITREYVTFPGPEGIVYYPSIVSYGFGISAINCQYKVVRNFHECVRDPETGWCLTIPKSECQVYTLGTGSWRSISPDASFEYNCRSSGVFLNGNLHWLVRHLKGYLSISCLNLETELFKHFSPPFPNPRGLPFLGSMVVLGDCLCICDNSSDYEIVIWIMKDYGVKKSWIKEFVISKIPDHVGPSYEAVYPIKVFKDGDILLLWGDFNLFYYSNNTKTIPLIDDMFEQRDAGLVLAMLHVSSFVSLKSFGMENVKSY